MYGYDIFHEQIMSGLLNSVHDGSSSHAYIFEGAEGTGVKTDARLFAAALTCQNSEIAPCGACPSCVQSKAGTNPDIVYVSPANDKKTIGADRMRELEEDAAIKPFSSKRKVYVFENSAELTEAAQNVILKTLEEPPAHIAFIIIAADEDSLLQTIRSRAVTVHFGAVSDDTVRRYIKKSYPDEEDRLEFLVRFCAGYPLLADKIIADEIFDAVRPGALEKLPLLLKGGLSDKFTLQKFIVDNKDFFDQTLDFWSSFLRDILMIKTGAAEMAVNVDKLRELRDIASSTQSEAVVSALDRLSTCAKMSARNVSIKGISMWLAM